MRSVHLERCGVRHLCDARLEAWAALLHEALVANPGCRVRRIAGGVRRKEMGFTRNSCAILPREPPRAFASHGGARRRSRVEGRDVLAIQDTGQIVLGNREKARQGYGPVGKGGNLRRGCSFIRFWRWTRPLADIVGLVDIKIRNRHGRKRVTKARTRPKAERESRRWGAGAVRAGEVLAKARSITAISDSGKATTYPRFRESFPKRGYSHARQARPENRDRRTGEGYSIISACRGSAGGCAFHDAMFPPLRAGRRAKRNWRYGSPL